MNKKSIIKTAIITGVIVLLGVTIVLCAPGRGGGNVSSFSLEQNEDGK